MSGDYSDRHHERSRVKLHFIEYIDVVRETHTNIENILKNGINDSWIEAKDVNLSQDHGIPDLAYENS